MAQHSALIKQPIKETLENSYAISINVNDQVYQHLTTYLLHYCQQISLKKQIAYVAKIHLDAYLSKSNVIIYQKMDLVILCCIKQAWKPTNENMLDNITYDQIYHNCQARYSQKIIYEAQHQIIQHFNNAFAINLRQNSQSISNTKDKILQISSPYTIMQEFFTKCPQVSHLQVAVSDLIEFALAIAKVSKTKPEYIFTSSFLALEKLNGHSLKDYQKNILIQNMNEEILADLSEQIVAYFYETLNDEDTEISSQDNLGVPIDE